LKARAWRTGALPSTEATSAYVLQPATPVVLPGGSNYTTPQSVTLTSATPAVAIRFTTDQSEPTEASALYTAPITVDTLTTLKTRAFAAGWTPSPIVTHVFTFNYGTVAAPTITPGSARYASSVTVAMSGATGASVRYTLDGSEPTEASALYNGSFAVTTATMVKAKAFRVNYTPSQTRTVSYWIQVATPEIALAEGAWPAGTLITSTTSTAGAKVHYTIDGREPTQLDPYFDASAPLHVGNFTLKG
jgi:hypothetical protein